MSDDGQFCYAAISGIFLFIMQYYELIVLLSDVKGKNL